MMVEEQARQEAEPALGVPKAQLIRAAGAAKGVKLYA